MFKGYFTEKHATNQGNYFKGITFGLRLIKRILKIHKLFYGVNYISKFGNC